jgi:hypothetical protein
VIGQMQHRRHLYELLEHEIYSSFDTNTGHFRA